MMYMSAKELVCCTNCKHLRLDIETQTADCAFKGKCEIEDYKNSKPYEKRPFYITKEVRKPIREQENEKEEKS